MTISSRVCCMFAAFTMLIGVAPFLGPQAASAAPGDMLSDRIVYPLTDANGVPLGGADLNKFKTSANGDRVTLSDKGDIWVLSAPDFENILIPTILDRARARSIEFSPDGQTVLAFFENTDGTFEFITAPTAGGTQSSLATVATGSPRQVEFTPDSSSVMILERIGGVDSARVVRVADSVVTLSLPVNPILTAVPTTDGVLVSSFGAFNLHPYDGSTPTQLHSGTIQVSGVANGSATYVRGVGNGVREDLWHVPLAGGTPTMVGVDVDIFIRHSPSFRGISPPLTHLFYSTAAGEYFVFDLATQTRVDLDLSAVNNPAEFGFQYSDRTISPNGDYFVITTLDQVVFGNTATGQLEVLPADHGSLLSSADILDDGTVAYRSTVGGTSSQLLVKKLGEPGPQLIATFDGTGSHAGAQFSPDGTSVIAYNLRDRRLVSLTGDGRISARIDFSEAEFLGDDYLVSQISNTRPSVYVIKDTDDPTISAAPDVSVPVVNNSGAPAAFDLPTVTDPTDPAPFVECDAESGDVFPVGDTVVTCNGLDNTGNSDTVSFTVSVTGGTTPPVVANVGDVVVEATSAAGANGSYVVPSATDQFGDALTPTCAPASGSVFALGDTIVTCSATDALGNTGSSLFTVTVEDTTAPVFPVISDFVLPLGTDSLSYSVNALDIVDGSVLATCDPVSTSIFPIGDTTVTCTATDAAGNSGVGSFVVTRLVVPDPVVSVPADVVLEGSVVGGAPFVFAATAVDALGDAVTPVTCDAVSGAVFGVGDTIVTCAATDSFGGTGSASFTVTVEDTLPPVFVPLVDYVLNLGDDTFSFSVGAVDIVDGSMRGTCDPASGFIFPIGDTTVTCTATDAAGNSAVDSFVVTRLVVPDPVVSVPADVVLEGSVAGGAPFVFAATAVDALGDAVTPVTCDAVSGAVFGVGDTIVTCSATDSFGGTGSALFTVTVEDTVDPVLSGQADVVAEATGPGGVSVSFAVPTASDVVDVSVAVSCDAASGDTFPVGVTTVACSATDAAGNTGTASFTVTVEDTTGPVVSVPLDVVVSASSATSGEPVSYIASASDLVDGPVAVTCSVPSGDVFPIGITTVTCTAQDAAGNTGSASFLVTVESGGIDSIISDLEDARDNANDMAAKDLNKAVKHAIKALDELAGNPPDLEKALKQLADAIKDIDKAIDDGYSASEAAAIEAAIVDLAQVTAQAAIDDAIARGGDAGEIDKAQQSFADALAELADGDLQKAVDEFADAAKHALKA